ncbi:MAG: rRNA pseudouridine synthase [Oscillospiraceae bacterium]|jgi:16S rRNA pseudouridine516 synthase|nr:rRNA pseudouridine synthase [Oscillospiraceae bacterium]
MPQKERLDKILASQGVGSRKEVHKLIWAGRVSVNGKTAKLTDTKIDPEKDELRLDGEVISYKKYIYIMMNKPMGVISASGNSAERTVIDLLPPELQRRGLFPAGRLDKDTTGLLIITNDGEFGHRLTAPNKQVYKTYEATLDSPLTESGMEQLRQGVTIDGGEQCRPAEVKLLSEDGLLAEIRICEGKYHQIKRMTEAVGCRVVALRRRGIGGLFLGGSLSEGQCRELTEEEKQLLFVKEL